MDIELDKKGDSLKIVIDGNVVSNATATVGTPARTVCTH